MKHQRNDIVPLLFQRKLFSSAASSSILLFSSTGWDLFLSNSCSYPTYNCRTREHPSFLERMPSGAAQPQMLSHSRSRSDLDALGHICPHALSSLSLSERWRIL